ncbi:N/A [soil metagenome]
MPRALTLPVYAAIRALTTAAAIPDLASMLSWARSAGRTLGKSRLSRSKINRALENIAVAFPDWSLQKRREYAEKAYEHLFMLAVEMIYTPRLLSHEGWAGRVDLSGLAPVVRSALAHRPVIFICGHCGNWEMAGYSLALLGFPMHALYRPLDLRPADAWVREVRSRRGLVLVDKFGAAKRMPEIIDAGAPLGFVADQNAGERGVFVPFFNRMASTYKAIGLTAMRFDATVVVGLALRQGHEQVAGFEPEPLGLRYSMRAADVFGPEDWSTHPDPLFYIAARYRRAIENSVRIAPEQNLWMHRFWKSRPRWERQGHPMPKAIQDKIRALPWTTEADMETIAAHTQRDSAAYLKLHPKAPQVAVAAAPESEDE